MRAKVRIRESERAREKERQTERAMEDTHRGTRDVESRRSRLFVRHLSLVCAPRPPLVIEKSFAYSAPRVRCTAAPSLL